MVRETRKQTIRREENMSENASVEEKVPVSYHSGNGDELEPEPVRPLEEKASVRDGDILTSWSAADLIRIAKEKPPQPIIEGLLNIGDIMLLHGTEESFKSVFIVQMGESIASGTPLLRHWKVARACRVGIIETEMHEAQMGERLGKMFPDGKAPQNLRFLGAEALRQWRRQKMDGKFKIIEKWVQHEGIEVLMVDTANDFFREKQNPSEETVVGGFFDQIRNLPVSASILVRHDHKKRKDDSGAHSNELIRGSAEFKEDPEVILYLKRTDRRTHEVELEVGKLRYGNKPKDLTLWFDAGSFRLTALPHVFAVLESGPMRRQEVLAECKARFGIEERKVDNSLAGFRPYLKEGIDGHQKVFEIDWEKVSQEEWSRYLALPPVEVRGQESLK